MNHKYLEICQAKIKKVYIQHLLNTKTKESLCLRHEKKIEIGKLFEQYCKEKNLPSSIKFGADNFFLGYDWIDFLLKCKATVGIEGGSNILDWDGSHAQKIEILNNCSIMRLKYNLVRKRYFLNQALKDCKK